MRSIKYHLKAAESSTFIEFLLSKLVLLQYNEHSQVLSINIKNPISATISSYLYILIIRVL